MITEHVDNAKKIFGLYAFRKNALDEFNSTPDTHLERTESCDTNRVLDCSFDQWISHFNNSRFQAVDRPEDISVVEKLMNKDPYSTHY